jgi:hypothetical protein
MTRPIIILFALTIFSCKDNGQNFVQPTNADINEIVKTIVFADSLPVTKTSPRQRPTSEFTQSYSADPLSIDLDKINIRVSSDTLLGFYLISDIMTLRANNRKFFQNSDSTYILFQASKWTKFCLDTNLTHEIVFTTEEAQNQIKKRKGNSDYFSFTIPIISLDQNRAYVILTKNCLDCGYGDEYFLERHQGKWTLIYSSNLWTN